MLGISAGSISSKSPTVLLGEKYQLQTTQYIHTFYPDKMVCQMAVFVRVTVAFRVLPKAGQTDVTVL